MSRRSVGATAAAAASAASASSVAAAAAAPSAPPSLRPPTCVLGCSWLSSFAPGSLLSCVDIDAHQSSCPLMDIQHRLAALEAADREAAVQALERQKQKALLLTQMKAQLGKPATAEKAEEAESEAESEPAMEPAVPAVKQEPEEDNEEPVPVRRTPRKRGRAAAAASTPSAPAAPTSVKLARSSSAAAASSAAADAASMDADRADPAAAAAASSSSAPRSPSSSGCLAFLHAPPSAKEKFISVLPEHLPLHISTLTPSLPYAGRKLEVFLLEDYHYISATELFALMTAEGLLTRRPPIPADFPAPTAAAASNDAVAWLEFLRDAWFKGTARSGGAKWREGFRWGCELSSEVVLGERGMPMITTHGVVNTVLYLAHLPDSIVLAAPMQTKIEELQDALADAMDSEPAATLRRDEGISLAGYLRHKLRDGSESIRKTAKSKGGAMQRK